MGRSPANDEKDDSAEPEIRLLRPDPYTWKLGCVGMIGLFLIGVILSQVGDPWVVPGLLAWGLVVLAMQFVRYRRCPSCGRRAMFAPARVGAVLAYGVRCLRCDHLLAGTTDPDQPDGSKSSNA